MDIDHSCYSSSTHLSAEIDSLGEFQHAYRENFTVGDGTVHFQYALCDHLGNTVVLFEDKDGNGAINSEYDYYYPAIGRFTGVDPLAENYLSLSPYSYVANNPLIHTDPTGRSIDGEFEKDKDGKWEKTSTKGDKIGVDFYHHDAVNGDPQITEVKDQEGNSGYLRNGRRLLQGQSRSNDVGMLDIFNEWKSGTGPEHSFFTSDHPSIGKINDHYLFKAAFNEYKQAGNSDGEMKFGLMDLLSTSTSDWMQMVGSFNYQFVQLGDKTLSVVSVAKTRNSFYYKGLGLFNITNYKRSTGNALGGSAETNTYQTYLFFSK